MNVKRALILFVLLRLSVPIQGAWRAWSMDWAPVEDALVDLSGLDQVASVGHGLLLDGNASLATIEALENLSSLGWRLTITGNPALSTCDAMALAERLEEGGWSDEVTISGNDSSCLELDAGPDASY